MIEELSPIQKVLLETFKAFAAFCKENNIQYFAAYGTLLGAVRHKGFIPWDDDIDVFILRNDYDKLLSLTDKLNGSGYSISSIKNTGHPYGFAKFYDATKTYIEYRHFPCSIGPFIDLFPLDETDGNNDKLIEDLNQTEWKYRKSIAHHSWREMLCDLKAFDLSNMSVKLIKKIFYSHQQEKLKHKIFIIEEQIKHVHGQYLRPYFNAAYKSIKFPRQWFDDCVEIPFEDTFISAPKAFDAFLSYTYGDYMKLPPVEKRTGGHEGFYVNFEEKISYKEALSRVPYKATPGLSLKVLWDELIHRKGFVKTS